ncbi:hypothetical protein I4U23_010949 [Adineta vaga]|nr:hypothetical protein I4U23_010949 [Adineta vaga]
MPSLSSLFRSIISSAFTCVSCRNKRSKKHRNDLDDIPDSLSKHKLTSVSHVNVDGKNIKIVATITQMNDSLKRLHLIEMIDNDNTSNTFSLQPMVEQDVLLLHNNSNEITNSLDGENVSMNTVIAPILSSSHTLSLQSNLSRTQSHDEWWIDDDDEIEKLFDELSTIDSIRTKHRILNPTLSYVNNNTTCENSNMILNNHLSNLSNLLTIHKQIEKQEYEEHQQLHGSKPNIYEYEIMKQTQKQLLNKSQMSITSDDSEKSYY